MGNVATARRGTHTHGVKNEILRYLQPKKDVHSLSMQSNLAKEERGLNSHITARFLIPRQHLEAFESNPDGCDSQRSPIPVLTPPLQCHREVLG